MKRFAVDNDIYETIINAIPSPVLIVDDDLRVHGYNLTASPLFETEPDEILRMGCGDAFHCIHSKETPRGCGGGEACKKCVIRTSVNKSYQGDKIVRELSEMQLVRKNKTEQIKMYVTTTPFKYRGDLYVLVILEDITELFELRNMLPICARCKKIRNDKKYWESVEDYLSRHFDLSFSHGICPECLKKLYPDFFANDD